MQEPESSAGERGATAFYQSPQGFCPGLLIICAEFQVPVGRSPTLCRDPSEQGGREREREREYVWCMRRTFNPMHAK